MVTQTSRILVILAINFLCLQLWNANAAKYSVDLNSPHEAGIVIIKVKKHLVAQCELHQIKNVKINACLNILPS